MALTTDTTEGFCNISPDDQEKNIDNILTRLEKLEDIVNQILSGDISANQLSDVSENIGWVYNVTYMGIPGWTQTAAGTLIPPEGVSLSTLGFTMSDGNTYPIVSVDANGVLQFGLSNTGQTGGSGGGGGGGGITSYLVAQPTTNTLSDNRPQLDTLYSLGSAFGGISFGGIITIAEAGFYHIGIDFKVNISANTTATLRVKEYDNSSFDNTILTIEDECGNNNAISGLNGSLHLSFGFKTTIANQPIEIQMFSVNNLIDYDKNIVTIEQLKKT